MIDLGKLVAELNSKVGFTLMVFLILRKLRGLQM